MLTLTKCGKQNTKTEKQKNRKTEKQKNRKQKQKQKQKKQKKSFLIRNLFYFVTDFKFKHHF